MILEKIEKTEEEVDLPAPLTTVVKEPALGVYPAAPRVVARKAVPVAREA